MKKKILLGITLVATLALTVACSSSKNEKSQKGKNTDSTAVHANNTKDYVALPENTMKIDEVAAGNFTSLTGTWKNESGSTLVFDSKGLVSDAWELKSKPEKKDGIIQISYGEKGKEAEGYKVLIIPAETKIPDEFFAEGSDGDISDNNRDRMLITKDPLTVYFEVYYKTSEKE